MTFLGELGLPPQKKKTSTLAKPKLFYAPDHPLKREDVDKDALSAIDRLQRAGFTAYLVGGGVRDLLAGVKPKDFDISTSARPEEVKALFRNCLLIGRRFRLAHLRFGRKVLEVSTFRTGDNDQGELIVQDNVWGSPEEDVSRRDFTMNGLFYDPSEELVIDYVDGWRDIQRRLLRTIGTPQVRFMQDPVRMIRLLKFQARFGYDVEKPTMDALLKCREEITKSAPARVMEELFKMLESGAATPFFQLLHETGLLDYLLPFLKDLGDRMGLPNLYRHLEAADKLVRECRGRLPDRAVLFSCLLYPVLEAEMEEKYFSQDIAPNMGHLHRVLEHLIEEVIESFFHFPRRLRAMVTAILMMQYRLTPKSKRKFSKARVIRNRDFPLALQFLEIRSMVDESLDPLFQEWKSREGEHQPPPPPPRQRRGPRRRRR